MIFVKKWQCFHLFVLRKIGQEKVFYDILEKKKKKNPAFLDYKNIRLKK